MTIETDASLDGKTVKDVIKSLKISARLLTRLKSYDDGICVNGEKVTVRFVLKKGDILTLNTDDRKSSENILPFNAPAELLWEDEWYAAFAKPAGIPTHPSRNHRGDTLASRVLYLYRDRTFVFRSLTRLDIDTSGAVIVAKNQLAANEFSKLLINRQVKKEYIAVCLGKIDGEGTVSYPIIRPDPRNIIRTVCHRGEEALTEYKALKSTDDVSLVSLSPVTGRTHQLRVHMKALNHPILSDTLYSLRSEYIDRQALHAMRVEFTHPFTKESVCVTCPLPDDMKMCIKRLFGEQICLF